MKDPITLYKEGEQPRRVWAVDAPGWLTLGWSETEPGQAISAAIPPEPSPEPPADQTSDPVTPSAYDTRKAELEDLLAQPQGWQKLAAIAKPLGIAKPVGGWDESILLILDKEGLEA